MKNLLQILFVLLFLPGLIQAQERTFIREYTYQASEADSKITARAMAVQELRTQLLHELGAFIQSEQIMVTTDYKDGDQEQDFQEKISAITAGITELEVLGESWNGSTYYIRASITVDPQALKKQLEAIMQDREKTAELEKLKRESEEAQAEILKLKVQLAEAKTLTEQLRLQQAYNDQTRVISAKEYFNMGYKAFAEKDYELSREFFQNAALVGGDPLIAFQNLGRISQRLDDHPGTIRYLSKVMAMDSLNDTDAYGLAFAYYYSGAYDSALVWCDKAIAIHFAKPEYYKLKSLCLKEMGREEASLESLKRAAMLGDPEAVEAVEKKK